MCRTTTYPCASTDTDTTFQQCFARTIAAHRRMQLARKAADKITKMLNDAASCIQRNWKAQKLMIALILKAVQTMRHRRATTIQRVYRGHLGRRRMAMFRNLAYAEFCRRMRIATTTCMRRRLLKHGAAQRIQTCIFRHHLARNRTKEAVQARYNAMATKIQSVWRMYVMKLQFGVLLRAKWAASLAIQRVWRGYCGRKVARVAAWERHRHRSATKIASLGRMLYAMKVVQERRDLYNNAARCIQKNYEKSLTRAAWSITYTNMLAAEVGRLLDKGVTRKGGALKRALQTQGTKALVQRLDILHWAIEKVSVGGVYVCGWRSHGAFGCTGSFEAL